MNEILNEELKLDTSALFIENVVTDRKTGAIKVFIPCDENGSIIENAKSEFIAIGQLMTPHGGMPISTPIKDVSTLKEAISKYGETIESYINDMIEEVKNAERDRNLIIPASSMPNNKLQLLK